MQYLYYYVEQREMHKLIGMHKQTKHNWGAYVKRKTFMHGREDNHMKQQC